MVFTREFIFETLKVDHNNKIEEVSEGLYSVPLLGLDEYVKNTLHISDPFSSRGIADVNNRLVTKIAITSNSKSVTLDFDSIEQGLIFLSLVTFDTEFFDFTLEVADRPVENEDDEDEDSEDREENDND